MDLFVPSRDSENSSGIFEYFVVPAGLFGKNRASTNDYFQMSRAATTKDTDKYYLSDRKQGPRGHWGSLGSLGVSLHVGRWDMDQTKHSKSTFVMSLASKCSQHTDVCTFF